MPNRIRNLLLILNIIVSGISGILSNIAAGALPEQWKPYLWIAWPLSFVSLVALIILNVKQEGPQSTNHYTSRTVTKRNRCRMIRKIKSSWLSGLGDDPNRCMVTLDLRYDETPDAIVNRLRELVKHSNSLMNLNFDKIGMSFERLNGNILILGEPGSGKTTLMLELAKELLAHAEREDTAPIPTIFNLASWSRKHLPLSSWLVEELNYIYDVPRSIGLEWIQSNSLALFLDGLDEVPHKYRADCIASINTFRQQFGLVPTVICCRTADYESSGIKLQLGGSVTVRPLEPDQFIFTLRQVGMTEQNIQKIFKKDKALWDLANSPLMINIIAALYSDYDIGTLLERQTTNEVRKQLFNAYIDSMIERHLRTIHYTKYLVVKWLSWLASQMDNQSQSIFYIDKLQPEWLPSERIRKYYNLLDRGGCATLLGLMAIPFFKYSAIEVIIIAGFFGGSVRKTPIQNRIWLAVEGAIVGGFIVTAGSIISHILYKEPGEPYVIAVYISLLFGQTFSLFAGIAGALNGKPNLRPRNINLSETLYWSWSKFAETAISGMVGGIVVGVMLGFIRGTLTPLIDVRLFTLFGSIKVALNFGFISGVTCGLIGGWSGGELAEKSTPYIGIRRTALNALLSVSIGGFICGIIAYLMFKTLFPMTPPASEHSWFPLFTLRESFFFWRWYAVVFGLTFGGYACLSYFALRIVLWYIDATPLHYIRFLNECVELTFLRRVGGGYMFTHRLLLEHFKSLYMKN